MNALFLFLIVALVATAIGLAALAYQHRSAVGLFFANIAEGTHAGNLPHLRADAAITTRHLLVKRGSDANHVAINTAADLPLGVSDDEATLAEDLINVNLLGCLGETRVMVGNGVIAADVFVFTAAGGKVQVEPTVAGTYYLVGRTISACAGDGLELEVQTMAPLKLVVVAAFTSTNGTAAAASASLANLAAEAEKIGDDVRSLGTALATPALVKVLAA